MRISEAGKGATVWVLIAVLVFLSLSALGGGGMLALAPDGHLLQMPMSNLKNTPFKDFLIPGILLFTFVGLYPLAVAYSLWKRPGWGWPNLINPFKQFHWSWAASLAAGLAVIVWITIQVQWLEFAFLHALYLVTGVVIVLLTLLPAVRRYCGRGAAAA